MYIDTVSNRSSPPAVLLRETYRENGKVKKRCRRYMTPETLAKTGHPENIPMAIAAE